MTPHIHVCPHCEQLFRCSADVTHDPGGSPPKYCSAEIYGDLLIAPLCEDCASEQGEIRDEMRREA